MVKKHQKNKPKNSQGFWDKEYTDATHLKMSTNPSEDLQKFTRFLERESGKKMLNPIASVLDLGCGNGRNLIYLAETYGMRGVGYDISSKAISEAKKLSTEMPIQYEVRSIAGEITLPDASQTLVLDMMASHFLNNEERRNMQKEIFRVLRPGGFLYLKTFLRTDDTHAERLLRDHPGEEEGSYIHPEIGLAEHVFTEKQIVEELEENFFTIIKISKSHRLLKRRSISIYAEKL